MGININTLQMIHNVCDIFKIKFPDMKICLLGNLYMRECTIPFQVRYGMREDVAMKYFQMLGADVTCIDINGKDGAEALDLSQPITKYDDKFDILINGGTCEHVDNQYICFQNVHRMCHYRSIAFHLGPKLGYWKSHSPHHFTSQFFEDLATQNKYTIMAQKEYMRYNKGKAMGKLLTYAFKRNYEGDFMSEEDFNKIHPTV